MAIRAEQKGSRLAARGPLDPSFASPHRVRSPPAAILGAGQACWCCSRTPSSCLSVVLALGRTALLEGSHDVDDVGRGCILGLRLGLGLGPRSRVVAASRSFGFDGSIFIRFGRALPSIFALTSSASAVSYRSSKAAGSNSPLFVPMMCLARSSISPSIFILGMSSKAFALHRTS